MTMNHFENANLEEHTQVLGRILRKYRRSKKLSQFSLSEAANINNSYYCSIEKGNANPTLKVFISICRGLKTNPTRILGEVMLIAEENEIYDE